MSQTLSVEHQEKGAAKLGVSYAYLRKKKSECMGKLTMMIRQSPEFNNMNGPHYFQDMTRNEDIERYLMEAMSGDERLASENDLKSNSALREETELKEKIGDAHRWQSI